MTPWTGRLIFLNVAVFLLTAWNPAIATPFVLVPALIPYRPWTVVTYMFLHAGWGHIFFNMLALYFFGPQVELRLGGRAFLGLYLVSGACGAVLSLLSPYVSIVGASGAIFGVMLAFARYWPRATILIWGVLPVQARVLVIVMTAISLFSIRTGAQGGIAHFAHLGGFVGGYLFLRVAEARSPAAGGAKRGAPQPPTRPTEAHVARWRTVDPASLHPVNREEFERVMAKVAIAGPGSLAPGEREFLDRFAAR
jgi:membrane associated rhomboid family serine protease